MEFVTTRDKIIDTASELFYDKGYNLTGINEIIEKAGIAKATLYSHFKSKEDLIIAYLDKKDAELLEDLKAFCNKKRKGNPRLKAILEFLIPFFNQDNFNGCWCIRSIAEIPKNNSKIREKIRTNKLKFKQLILDIVKENKAELKSKQQLVLANRIYLLYESAITESHIHNEDWPIKESIAVLETLLKMK